MQTVLTILGIVGLFSLIVLFIKAENTHKSKELSLQKEIDSLKKGKSNHVVAPPVVATVAVASAPASEVVVAPQSAIPVVVTPAPTVVVAPPVVHNRSVTVKITNNNGTVSEVMLVRKGNDYVGPQGEYYDIMPTTEQLSALYGK